MANGTFTPQPIIQSRADLGRRLLAQAGQGQRSTAGLSPFANLLQGLQGGLERGQATSAAQTNQALQAEATRNIGEALARGDLSGASSAAFSSDVPGLFNVGASLAGQAATGKRAEETRVAQAQQVADKLALERRKVAVLERPKVTKETTLVRNLKAAGLTPGTPEFQKAALAGTTKPLVSVGTGGQKKFSERLMAKAADRFDAAQTAAEGASTDLADLEVLESALTSPEVYTGVGGEALNKLKLAGQTLFGLNFQGVADAEVASRTSKRLAIAMQKDLPLGKISNSDRDFLQSIPPGLNASPEANRRLIAVTRLNAQRKIDRARIMESNLKDDGTFDRRKASTELAQYDRGFRRTISAQVREMKVLAAQLKTKSPFAGIPISQMGLAQIQSLNPDNFTKDQLKQIIERERALAGAQ